MSTVEFKMLGKFYIEASGNTVDAADILGRQLSSLLAYFVYHRNRIVSKDMLITSFWPESENPNSAIKYAIFRLRNELSKICEYDWIITSKMGYMLNPALEVKVDLDTYESCYKSIVETKDLKKLFELGDTQSEFLVEYSEEWILSIREYFNELYNKMIVTVCSEEFSKENPNYADLIHVCKKALEKDPFSESIILFYCKALIETREYNRALAFFEKMCKKFNDDLGIPLGDNIRKLFLGDQQETGKTVHIEEIPKEFEEDLIANGPLFVHNLHLRNCIKYMCVKHDVIRPIIISLYLS
ncbi:MAG: winged helix-turn-helix domain-containing protein [Longicatena sp.]